MRMTIDAMDLLYRGHIDGFGIMSSDSDFMPVAMRIRQNGLPVYGFGTQRTPEGFRQACTRFIDVSAVAAAEAAASDPQVEDHPLAKPEVGADLIKLLGDAWKASKRDEHGFTTLSELGQRAANRSSFDARSYGFSRLSELLESLPNFEVQKRPGGAIFVKRLR
jgi:hypothetical protein